MSLHDVVERGDVVNPNERARIIAELVSAIAHLHSHDLAHNYISPWNVMMDEELRVVLIDFGACLPFGHFIHTIRGTRGFSAGDWTFSDPAHDAYGLEAIRQYLDDAAEKNQVENSDESTA